MLRFIAWTGCAAALLLCGCGKQKPDPVAFQKLTGEFVYSSLALSPVSATAAGYHSHNGVALDAALDDFSDAGIGRQRQHFLDWKKRLSGLDRAALDADAKADLELMESQVEAGLLELDVIQGYRHNPTVYVELVGNAIFTPYSVDYAPPAERWRQIIARLRALPALLEAGKSNLVDSTSVWTKVAIEENEGNLALVETEFPAKVPAELKSEYDAAARAAAAAMRAFNDHLRGLKDAGAQAWRLGAEKYAAKFRTTIGSGLTPERLLADAEADLLQVRKEMFMASLPLHLKYYPSHKDRVDLNLIVGETLEKVARKHAKPEAYFNEAEKSLAETRAFLQSHEDALVKSPPRDNLNLIPTPEFMRGIYGVGGFNPAPALQPELGAFYWLTPIPKEWPKDRAESKLREYNDYGLRILTIHEAIPGHYVQFEYASGIEPKERRLLRAVFGNGPYIEGWAVYATEAMLDAGYMKDDPEMRLTFGKQLLRAIANTILDIKLHTQGMTDDEAMKLMLERTFQEKEEAVAKLQRAKLSSCQLPTYFAGYRAWKDLRKAAQAKPGFKAGEFHKKALQAGALPLGALRSVLGL